MTQKDSHRREKAAQRALTGKRLALDVMPPLLGPAPTPSPSLVPVIGVQGKRDKGKAPVRHPPRRQYNDEPLPVKPNTTAPKNAHIIGREQEHDGGLVGYRLKIGDVEINGVGVDEILDYVSALELEQFEMLRFREDIEILKVLEQDMEVERKEARAKAAERASMKGAVFVEDGSDSDGLAGFGETDEPADVQIGKHGRARPDYSKFYKPPRGKDKKVYGDLVDEEMADDSMQTNIDEPSASRSGAQQEQPRRRRRRDPTTGELMPLAPLSPPPKSEHEKHIKKRRKRHPLTGMLMPLGWRYDPETDASAQRQRMGLDPAPKEPSFKRLSISEHHEAKRPRLDTESSAKSSSVSPIPTKADIMAKAASQSTPKAGVFKAAVVDLMSSDDELNDAVSTPKSGMKPPPKQAGNSMMRGTIEPLATTSAEESSPEPVRTTSTTRPSATSPSASQRTRKAQQPVTSMLAPSAARASSVESPPAASEEGTSDDEGDEWFIESILAHRMSDPKSHPPELGKQPVMLYSVKWEGYDSPTWEPMDSFGDRSFVDAYRKKVGLKPIPGDEDDEDEDTVQQAKPATKSQAVVSASSGKSATEDDEDVEVFELERIVTHYLSDPRTHPKELGKIPVMLYQVKWKGWNEMTWEPEDSFDDDPKPLHAYKRKHGLR